MLVLTRKQNEKIRIGSSIVITVVRMKGKAVRLGIEAPTDVSVLRGELAFETSEDQSPTSPTVKSNETVVVAEESESRASIGTTSHRTSTKNWPTEKQSNSAVPNAVSQRGNEFFGSLSEMLDARTL